MREIPLTQGKVALVDDEDYERVMQFKWHAVRGRNSWYARRSIRTAPKTKQKTLWMHRLLVDAAKGDFVDHSDGDGLKNTRQNVRKCTRAQNARNQRTAKHNTSGFKGVSFHKLKRVWQANIRVDSRLIYLGSFKSAEEAAKAYDKAAVEHHRQFSRLNFQEAA